MIPDDINNDDEFDDNFDVEDEFDDGLDEDWDDDGIIDDIPDMPGTEAPSIADTIDSPDVILPTGEKTFIQKFFMPIVVGVVALFGLLFVLGSGILSGGPETVETPIVEEEYIAQAEQNNAPPSADEPVAAIKDELPELPISANDAPIPAEPLTPLPGEEGPAAEETFELVDLDAELAEETNVNLDEAPALPDEPIVENALAENALSDNSDVLEIEPPLDVTSMETAEVLDVEAEDIVEAADEIVESEAETLVEAENAPPVISDAEVEPALEEAAVEEVAQAVEEAPVSSAENDALKQQIEESRDTIEGLREELAALKAKVDSPVSKEETPTPAVKEEAPAVVDVIKETKQEAAKVVTKTTSRRAPKAIKWELRSAQPGKATISQVGSQDMRTVEIGQTIPGLGRIRAIQIESGLWVVRGTTGSVSQ